MIVTIIIPVRLDSTRLAEKAIADIDGKSMIQWVYEACLRVNNAQQVIIATDHPRIREVAESFHAKVGMTSSTHQSGTDRCAEIAKVLESDLIINVQGDEPFMNPQHIENMISFFAENESVNILTLFRKFDSIEEAENPNNVKLVKSISNKIKYFSRSLIPYPRRNNQVDFYKHIGIYGFRRSTLLELTALTPSVLELKESLEQLRWLENDYDIYGLEVESQSIGIDTPEDLARARTYAEGLSK